MVGSRLIELGSFEQLHVYAFMKKRRIIISGIPGPDAKTEWGKKLHKRERWTFPVKFPLNFDPS